MAEKIYVITAGEYSDYHIIAATTDRDKAERIVSSIKRNCMYYDDPDIEEYSDSAVYDKPLWEVHFSGLSSNANIYRFDEYDVSRAMNGKEKINEVKTIACRAGSHIKVVVEANDEESAIKIAREIRAEWLADKNGMR